MSRFTVFRKVIETGSFTAAAEALGYTQSAVSQAVKSLEEETGMVLLERNKTGIKLTKDGEALFPYIEETALSEIRFERKVREMRGLSNSIIRIGTFTSISRNELPQYMKEFQNRYPDVSFVLDQGEYTGIASWIREGRIDFGFIHGEAVDDLPHENLYEDRMMAVLPVKHPLSKKKTVTLEELSKEPFILLDEGQYSTVLNAFEKAGIRLNPRYRIYDDYTILEMIRQNLGVSLLFERVVQGFDEGVVLKPVKPEVKRTVALAYRSTETLPYASSLFAKFVLSKYKSA